MGRLTIEKETKEMGMYELALNSCYVKDGLARYRDFETDIDCRELARSLMVSYGVWKGMKEHGLDADNELVDDDIFDESILESLQYGTDTIEGLIALFYRNLWAMAYLRTKLKHYEDLEEAGRLIELPCAVGDTVYFVGEYGIGGVKEYEVGCIVLKGNADYSRRLWEDVYGGDLGSFEDIGETVFLTKEEAEAKLRELNTHVRE